MMLRRFMKWFFDSFEFPQEKNSMWYCGDWYTYLADLEEEGFSFANLNPDWEELPVTPEGKFIINPYRTGLGTRNEDDLVDGLIPAVRVGDRVGLYGVVGVQRQRGYDGAPWDNGVKIDLQFVRAVPIDQTCHGRATKSPRTTIPTTA